MPISSTSFRLPGNLVFATVMLFTGSLPKDVLGAPAPKPTPPFALLFVQKAINPVETARNRRYQIAQLRDRSVLCAALLSLKDTDLPSVKKQDNSVEWLRRSLKAEYLVGTGVLRISLTDGSRKEQALLANAVAQACLRVEVSQQRQRTEERLDALRRCLELLQPEFARLNPGGDKQLFGDEMKRVQTAIKRCEDELRVPPQLQLLELAEVPPE